jgi:phenylpropionate dioxygenase-like ring-hydroxylating dioxygenase large terminal subunit
MLTPEDNALLTRVGPGSPAGEMLRRYWIPMLISDELGERDGTPVRVKLFGEELVAFRDTEGRVGLMEEFCAHRGASLFYGRNEECGLRCIYHGWKYDVSGTVVETPNEPGVRMWEGSLRQRAYPTHEAGGAIWAYLGPADAMPEFPAYQWNVQMNTYAKKVLLDCNYVQGIEGGIDSSHLSFLHRSGIVANPNELATRDVSPRLELQDLPYGFRYGALRKAPAGDSYVRITPFIMPWYTIVPFPADQTQAAHAWVPIDDEHTWIFTFNYTHGDDPITPDRWTHPYELAGAFVKRRNRANNHLQDRAAMKIDSWSGIALIPDQDAAIQESMKSIYDRSTEHLGQADMAVIHMRATMLASIRAVQEGRDPVGIRTGFPAERIRCENTVVPADTPWREIGAVPVEAAARG